MFLVLKFFSCWLFDKGIDEDDEIEILEMDVFDYGDDK